jgi:Tfp pilus assembly protein PilO
MASLFFLRSTRALQSLLHAAGALTATAIAVAGILGHSRIQAKLAGMRAESQGASALLDRTHETNAALQEAGRDLRDAETEAAALLARLPEAAGETTFLEQLSALAERTDVELHEYRPGAVAQRATHQEIELHFSGEGQYAGVCRFLAGLRDLPRCYQISQCSVAAPNVRGENCALDVHLRLAFGVRGGERLPGVAP